MTTLNIRPFHGDYHSSMKRIFKKNENFFVSIDFILLGRIKSIVVFRDHKLIIQQGQNENENERRNNLR